MERTSLPLKLTIFLLTIAHVQPAVKRKSVEAFPSCVEIVDINPPPYSVVNVLKSHVIWFEVTFSKPVYPKEYGEKRIFLFPDDRGPSSKTLSHALLAARIQQNTTTARKWAIKFNLGASSSKHLYGKIYRTFYLMIDGNIFNTYEYISSQSRHKISVPFSIFGAYYYDQDEKIYQGNKTVQPLSPSPYCWPTPIRRLPDQVGSTSALKRSITIEIPERGHEIGDLEYKESTLYLLALVNGTSGRGMVSLPRSVTVPIQSINYTVQLPASNLTFDIPLIYWRFALTQKIVYELVERVYHVKRRGYGYTTDPTKITSLNENGNKHTFPSLSIYKTKTKASKKSKKSKETLEGIEMYDGGTNVKILEFQKTEKGWLERGHAAPLYIFNLRPKKPLKSKRHFLRDNMKFCPVNSTRNPGRAGRLYHTIEYGRFYQMAIPKNPLYWKIYYYDDKRPMHVTLNTARGNEIDLSKNAKFGWKNSLISSRLIKAVLEDYVCLLAAPTKTRYDGISIGEACIFVPKTIADSTECGGLRLFENIKNITSDPDFCSKKLGDCIGKPFSSPTRFPTIPPFGLPELSGWTVLERKMSVPHPAGNAGPFPGTTQPLLSYKSWYFKDKIDRWVYGFPYSHLYQLDVHHIPITGVKVTFPHVKFKKSQFCKSVWKLTIVDTITSSLTAHINNTGEGGGDFVISVNCSSLLEVFPFSGTKELWIDPVSESAVRFALSSTPASHVPEAQHNCQLSVRVKSAKIFSDKAQQFPSCTETLTTYHGLFIDPCRQKEQQLPAVDMKYYILPPDQLDPLTHDKFIHKRASLPEERKLSFIKAITVSLGVPDFQHTLIRNLRQLHVHCGRPDVFITASYGEFLVHQATGGISNSTTPSKPSLVFSGDDILPTHTVYFFLPKRKSEVEEPVYTDCWVELWANRPHPLCDKPILVSYKAIPLRDHDQKFLEGDESKLAVVYGNTSDIIQTLLIGCIVLSVILCLCGGILHGILLLLRKKLPQSNTLKKYRKDLKNAQKADTEYWENPQMFLSSGEHRPYYKLHSFRATDCLDTRNIRDLKIAGTLRYENKELPVLFGHIKKIYLDKSGETKNAWVQASSGMYLLSLDQVMPEYRKEYCRLLKRHGIKVKPSEFEGPSVKET